MPDSDDDGGGADGDSDDDVTSGMVASHGSGAGTHSRATAAAARRRAAAAPADPVHAVRLERARQLRAEARAMSALSARQLRQELAAIEADLARELERLAAQQQGKRADWRAAQAEALAKLAAAKARREEQLKLGGASAESQRLLDEARRQRERLEAEAARRRAEEEAAAAKRREDDARRRREQEEQQRRAEAAAKAEADAKAQAAAAAAAKQQQQQDEQQQKQQQQQAATSPAAAAAPKPAGTSAAAAAAPGGDLKAAPGALEWERQMAEKLAAAEAAVSDLMTRPELKPQRRQIEKKATLIVSQIAGTQQQISDKVDEALRLLASCPDAATKTLACLALATRVVAQCDSQVANCAAFAFPLALACVRIGAAAPLFVDLLIAKLHRACILTVPKYYTYRPNSGVSEAEHFARLGYASVDDAKRPGAKRLETTDEYAARVAAHVHLYAALLGTPGGDAHAPHPHPAANGWAWLARHLNALPATRVTAAALHAFVGHAGFALSATFRRQFVKVLRLIYDEWLPDLGTHDDDAAAVATRLRTYLDDRLFERPPEGLAIKRTDVSSWWGLRDEPPQGGGGRGGGW